MNGIVTGILIVIIGFILYVMWSRREFIRNQKEPPKGEMEDNGRGAAEDDMGMNGDDG